MNGPQVHGTLAAFICDDHCMKPMMAIATVGFSTSVHLHMALGHLLPFVAFFLCLLIYEV